MAGRSKRGTSVTTVVDDKLLRFIDRYAEERAVPRAQAMRELMEVAYRVSTTYKVAVQTVATRGR